MGAMYDIGIAYDSSLTYGGVEGHSMGDAIDARCFLALRKAAVATAAGITVATWGSTTVPRVFKGLAGFLGGRNRGRLPFLEFDYTLAFALDTRQGGTSTANITVRLHLGGRDAGSVGALSMNILLTCLGCLRSEGVDNYFAAGDSDAIGPIQPGPWGSQRDASLIVEHTFDRATYQY